MRKNRFVLAITAFVCAFTLIISAFAVETRASDQINDYMMDVTTSKNSIDVRISVTGCGTVNKLGCESIKVYEESGSRWILSESLDEDDEGMSRTNFYSHKNMIYCTGKAGVEYKVVVTIFAENDAGRDTRTRTFYVTGE